MPSPHFTLTSIRLLCASRAGDFTIESFVKSLMQKFKARARGFKTDDQTS